MSVTLSSIAVSSCSYLSTMLERMLLCNTARRWTTPVLAGSFLPKTGIDCRRHQVHLGRVDCHKPAPAQKDVYTYYYLCGKRAGVAVLHVKEQRVKVYGYLGPHLRLFGLLLALAYSSSALLSRWNACWTPQSSGGVGSTRSI